MKILHIEDNDSISEPIGIFLESEGHEYETTTDGKKGLELIRSNHYDVILLDLSMPNFSGRDVILELDSDGSLKKEKIVILSASVITSQEMKELREIGVHSSLGKPIIHSDLLAKLKLIEADHSIVTNVG
jgi:DNA-binding response OmpR family regulator